MSMWRTYLPLVDVAGAVVWVHEIVFEVGQAYELGDRGVLGHGVMRSNSAHHVHDDAQQRALQQKCGDPQC